MFAISPTSCTNCSEVLMDPSRGLPTILQRAVKLRWVAVWVEGEDFGVVLVLRWTCIVICKVLAMRHAVLQPVFERHA